MRVRPRAKVNLSLLVGPRGVDGLHSLSSVFLRVGLADELTVGLADGAGNDVLTVAGLPGADVEGNLVLRAFRAVRAGLGAELPPLAAHLDKRIPIAAGLGGGSADAAAAVECALGVWGAGLAPGPLAELAMGLGSDVPFFCSAARAALVSGHGEQVQPLSPPIVDLALVLVTPPISLSTAAVFTRFDELAPPERQAAQEPLDLSLLPESALEFQRANDLWPAAVSLAPQLAVMRDELERLSGRPWLMSGSGSTLFALYLTPSAAVAAARALVASESESLGGCIFNAVDLIGPDPLWRYP